MWDIFYNQPLQECNETMCSESFFFFSKDILIFSRVHLTRRERSHKQMACLVTLVNISILLILCFDTRNKTD